MKLVDLLNNLIERITMQNKTIILASSSPRRIEMFQNHGIDPVIIAPNVDETIPSDMSKEAIVMFLALKKGLEVEKEIIKYTNVENENTYIVAADTIVYKDKIIGKPTDYKDAFNILQKLRNTSHFVITGVAIIKVGTTTRKVFYDVTEVFFGDYTDNEIQYYIDNDEVYDKAGSYAIQSHIWKKNITHINGDYNNIVGFPWGKFIEEFNTL